MPAPMADREITLDLMVTASPPTTEMPRPQYCPLKWLPAIRMSLTREDSLADASQEPDAAIFVRQALSMYKTTAIMSSPVSFTWLPRMRPFCEAPVTWKIGRASCRERV